MLDRSATAELIEKARGLADGARGMATNRYSAPFKGKVQDWIAKLSTVEEIIEMWLVVQNMWMYMEAVFSGGDIVKQLPSEAKRFKNIDKQFVQMAKVARGGDSERRRGLLRQQRSMMDGVTGAHGAARAVPEGSHCLSGHQAGDVPALLFRL